LPLHNSSFILRSENPILAKTNGRWQAPCYVPEEDFPPCHCLHILGYVGVTFKIFQKPSEPGIFLFRRNVTWAGVQNLLARFEDQTVTSMASFPNSSDSYNGDDVRCYLHERDEALGHHWEATCETEHLEATLATSQTAPATMEGESSATRAHLADSDARVVGETFRRNHVPLSFFFVVLFLMIPSLLITTPTEESEALQLVTNNATGPLNARGDLLANCLLDIPVRAREIALHGVRLGATVAVTIA
jgi:hypothetical protein